MSSGRYCLIRDLGLVKGGKGLRHHEVLIAFSLRAALQRVRRVVLERFNPAPAQAPDVETNFGTRSLIGEAAVRNPPSSKPQSMSS